MFRVPTLLTKRKQKKITLTNGKDFQCPLNRFELDDVSDLKIIVN